MYRFLCEHSLHFSEINTQIAGSYGSYMFRFFFFFLAALGLRYCARAFSSWGERGLLFVAVRGFLLRWLLLLQSTGSRHSGFSSCGTAGSVVVVHGLVAPRHVGSSRTRVHTHVPCIGRLILNHCATREAPHVWWPTVSNKMFNRSRECQHPCCISNLRENVFKVSPQIWNLLQYFVDNLRSYGYYLLWLIY